MEHTVTDKKAPDKPQQPIPLPPVVNIRMSRIAGERDTLRAGVDGKNATLRELAELTRELLGVPADWVLKNLDVGFEPPPAKPAEPPAS